MTRRMFTWIGGLAAALLLVGTACGPETRETWNEPMQIAGPAQTANKSIYLNKTLEELRILQPTRSGGEVGLDIQTVETGADPSKMRLSANGEQLYVIESGDEALGVYDLTSSPPTRQTVSLDSTYDRMTVDPAGDFLLLSFSGSDDSNCIACNLNELGVVDLRNGVPDEAQFVTLPKRAEDLVFAENFSLGGSGQRLVAALSSSQISIIDLKALTSGDQADAVREVPLTTSQAAAVKQPTDAVFHVSTGSSNGDGNGGDDATKTVSLYVLTRGGSDVTQVSIKPSRQMGGDRKFDLSVNQLAAGNNPSAMTVLDLPQVGTRLLTIDSGQRRFHLVDVQSGEGSSFQLPMAAEDLLVYNTIVSTSDGDRSETRVLAWSTRSRLVAVIRPASIAVGSDDPTVGRSVEAIRLETAPTQVRMDPSGQGERDRAVAFHTGAQAGFSVLQLAADQNDATFIKGSSLSDLHFSGNTAFGVFTGRPNFGRFNLQNGHPTTFKLPSPGQNLLYDNENKTILVDHGKQHGEFTVIDANEPSPDNATVFQGVFVRDLLQKELPKADE